MREILFKVCVLPAFEYSVNIWGVGGFDSSLWSQVERFWNSAARRILGLPTRTPIVALLGDLGRRPFEYCARVMACKFWTRAIELPFNSLVHQALIVQRQLVVSGDKCWLSKLRTTLNESECGACSWDKYFSVYPTFGDPVSVSVVSPGTTLLKSVGRRTLRRIAQVFTIENGGVRCHQ
jgi:hypothetical protein